MDLQTLQAQLREKALQRAKAEKTAAKSAAPAGKVKRPIIDFRYRPNTKSIIGGIAESPIFRAGLIANGVDIDEFYSRARTMPEIIADLKEHNVMKAVIVSIPGPGERVRCPGKEAVNVCGSMKKDLNIR